MSVELVTVEEAAALLFVSRPHVRKLVDAGKLSATDGMLHKAEVLEYRSRQQAAAKEFLAGQTEEYWSTDDTSGGGHEPSENG
jgi:DNA binding domain, excisionase family